MRLCCETKLANVFQHAPEIGAWGEANGSISLQKRQPNHARKLRIVPTVSGFLPGCVRREQDACLPDRRLNRPTCPSKYALSNANDLRYGALDVNLLCSSGSSNNGHMIFTLL